MELKKQRMTKKRERKSERETRKKGRKRNERKMCNKEARGTSSKCV
jgi:hypothetical protein